MTEQQRQQQRVDAERQAERARQEKAYVAAQDARILQHLRRPDRCKRSHLCVRSSQHSGVCRDQAWGEIVHIIVDGAA